MIPIILVGLVGGVGILLVASGRRRAVVGRGHRPPRSWLAGLQPEHVVIPAAAALAALVLTRWPAAALLSAVASWSVARRAVQPVQEAARAEAIALLIEQLKNAAGAADGVETVLGNAARHAPSLIRGDVGRGTARLAYEPLEVVLADLAEALHHPSGDQVVRAMRQVATQGGSLQRALDRLAHRTRALAEMHRRIEVAREQPRSTMRTVTVVVAIFTALLFVGARDWMRAYDTATGQVVLVCVAAWFVFWHRQMGRLARIAPIERFYGAADTGAPR